MPVKMTSSDKLILTSLAVHWRLSTSEIIKIEMRTDAGPTKVKLSSSIKRPATVRERLKVLSGKGLIIVVKEEPCVNKKGTERWYDITIRGLITLLSYEMPWEYIEQIAENQQEKIPLVFGKWNLFSVVKNELKRAVMISLSEPLRDFSLNIKFPDKIVAERFSAQVVLAGLSVNIAWAPSNSVPLFLNNEKSNNWSNIISLDSELSNCLWAETENIRRKLLEATELINQLENSNSMYSVINKEEKRSNAS